MVRKEQLLSLYDMYLTQYPDELEETLIFKEYLERTEDDMLYNRKNFDGHITTSAFVVDEDGRELLLLRHKSLEKWLQPGGHTEGDASLIASALREVMEETGIRAAELSFRPSHTVEDVPFDIDSHYIPANPKKNEDGHYHHDIRYVFVYKGDRRNEYNDTEATGMKWLGFDELIDDVIFGDMVPKLHALLDNK